MANSPNLADHLKGSSNYLAGCPMPEIHLFATKRSTPKVNNTQFSPVSKF
jgi:hypothetical protein